MKDIAQHISQMETRNVAAANLIYLIHNAKEEFNERVAEWVGEGIRKVEDSMTEELIDGKHKYLESKITWKDEGNEDDGSK